MKRHLLLAAALVSTPALAQEAASPPPAAATATPIDAERVPEAQKVVDHIFPAGTYTRIMNGTMDSVMKSVMAGMGDLPMKDIGRIAGLPDDQLKDMGEGTLKEMMSIIDPAFNKRMEAMTGVMMVEMTKLMNQFEPGVREGLTSAYARRFSKQQLADLNQFFATPTGSLYASESMMLFMDPEVMNRMMAMMPEMTRQMPAMMGAVEKALAEYPKPKTYADLTKPERARLAKLLGISEAELASRNKASKKH
jgi:hypothetical protein